MDLIERIEEFCKMIGEIAEKLDDVNNTSRRIPEVEVAQLGRQLAGLMESMEEASSDLKVATELLEEIRRIWG